MRFASLVLPLLFAAGTVGLAQTSPVMSSNASVVSTTFACPGSLTARPQGGPAVQWTVAREDQSKPDAKTGGHAGVHVALASFKDAKEIEVAVEFLPAGARLAPIDARKPGAQAKDIEQSKTFEVSSSDGGMTVEGDLLLGPVFQITRVRLLTVKYADGSAWHGMLNECAVAPSLYMPVAAK